MITAGLMAAFTAAKWLTIAGIVGDVGNFCFIIAPEVSRMKAERAKKREHKA